MDKNICPFFYFIELNLAKKGPIFILQHYVATPVIIFFAPLHKLFEQFYVILSNRPFCPPILKNIPLILKNIPNILKNIPNILKNIPL